MKNFRKLAHLLLLAMLIFTLPTAAFAETATNVVKEGTYPKHVRIPVTLVPNVDESNKDAIATRAAINGYLDFWSEVHGRTVDANWVVTITTPNVGISNVNLTLKWGLAIFDPVVPFKYPTFGMFKTVRNQASKTYDSAGTRWATISGNVTTLSSSGSTGTAFTISPGTIEFYVP